MQLKNARCFLVKKVSTNNPGLPLPWRRHRSRSYEKPAQRPVYSSVGCPDFPGALVSVKRLAVKTASTVAGEA